MKTVLLSAEVISLTGSILISGAGWSMTRRKFMQNTVQVVKKTCGKNQELTKNDIKVLGISNQRETALVWDRNTGKPVYNAVVWQCARGAKICERIAEQGHGEMIRSHTGLQLSPYFSAAKIAWVLENVEGAAEKAEKGEHLLRNH